MANRSANLTRKIDRLLDEGEPTGSDAEALAELLRPAEGGGVWPDIEHVLRVAEHRAVEPRLRQGALPDVLDEALSEALRAVMPMLGERAFGPTYKLARGARRTLRAETRKFEVVRERIDEGDSRERAVRILRNYIETAPAPLFVTRMRRQFPELLAAAEQSAIDEDELDALAADEALVDAFLQPSKREGLDAGAIAERLEELDERLSVDEMLILAALDSEHVEHRAMGAVLAVWKGLEHRAPILLGKATRGEPPADLFAVAAGRLAPMMTRNVLGQLVAEASWGNPEEPEQELTEARSTAILVARCLLPHVGSPLDELDEVELSDDIDFPGLDEIPSRIQARWRRWETLEA